MSRNSKSVVQEQKQKYCKVCHDAGKTEAEYRSHFTRESRDNKAKVCCPTLLALECRYCFKSGHTVKYCPSIKEKENMKKREETSSRRVEKTQEKPKGKPTNKNIYAILDSDSEDEPVIKSVTKEEYPALIAPSVPQIQLGSGNYAAMASKPAAPKPSVAYKPVATVTKEVDTKPVAVAAPWASTMTKSSTINWAASDSEDEDEYPAEEDDEW
jgi:hypothetical protein